CSSRSSTCPPRHSKLVNTTRHMKQRKSMTVGSATSARWGSEKWRSATYAEPSDEEEGFDLRQPFPFVNAYPNAPAFEGRNARPLLNADSKSSSFQDAFDEQQSFWRRKWKNDPQFQQEISNCAH